MTKTLAGRTIIVTGAGAGIGLGILKAVIAQGATAYGFDLSPESIDIIRAAGGTPIRTDVRDPQQLRSAIRQARTETGRLDGLVNNAGLTLTAPFLEADIEMWDKLWQTNLRSVLTGCQAAAQIMVADKTKGALVNISSVHATASDVTYEGYAATKGAITALARPMAWSLGPHQIRVNTIAPGLTMTEKVAQVAQDPEHAKLFASWHADGQTPAVDEVAQVAVFLLSDASAALTGMEIIADKGTTARLCNVG